MITHLIGGESVEQQRAVHHPFAGHRGGAGRGRGRRRGRGRHGAWRRPRRPSPNGPARRPTSGQDHAPAGRADRKGGAQDAERRWRPRTPACRSTRPGHALIPRAADNFYFFSEVATRMDGKCYPVDDQMLRLHPGPAGRGLRAYLAVERAVHDGHLEDRAPCLALGNTAVLKVSELSPLTADGSARASWRPGCRRACSTSSTAMAARRARRWLTIRTCAPSRSPAARRRKPHRGRGRDQEADLELGGKSPVLIFEDADLERALDAALFTIFSLNGERCTRRLAHLHPGQRLWRLRRGVRRRR